MIVSGIGVARLEGLLCAAKGGKQLLRPWISDTCVANIYVKSSKQQLVIYRKVVRMRIQRKGRNEVREEETRRDNA